MGRSCLDRFMFRPARAAGTAWAGRLGLAPATSLGAVFIVRHDLPLGAIGNAVMHRRADSRGYVAEVTAGCRATTYCTGYQRQQYQAGQFHRLFPFAV